MWLVLVKIILTRIFSEVNNLFHHFEKWRNIRSGWWIAVSFHEHEVVSIDLLVFTRWLRPTRNKCDTEWHMLTGFLFLFLDMLVYLIYVEFLIMVIPPIGMRSVARSNFLFFPSISFISFMWSIHFYFSRKQFLLTSGVIVSLNFLWMHVVYSNALDTMQSVF